MIIFIQLEMSDVVSERRRSQYRRKELFHQPVSGPGMKKTGMDRQTSVVAPQCSTLVQEREVRDRARGNSQL
jgi:hypothetical protein